jgi:hypothetical protein
MNKFTQHNPASTGPAGQRRPAGTGHRGWRTAGAGILATAAIAAALSGSAPPASATLEPGSRHGRVGSPPDRAVAGNRLEATFTATPVWVTPNLGIVELILRGTGTVQGFGAATDVTGVVEDHSVSPCGTGGASDSAQKRIVMQYGVLVLHEAGTLCLTASGPQVTATYQVDGQASTGIFAGARGTGDVTVNVATGHETLSGKLILVPPAA